MNLRTAYAIFKNINSDQFTDEEKGEAIEKVANMETHNGVTKDDMLGVIKYLWDLCFEWPQQAGEVKPTTNADHMRAMSDAELAEIITAEFPAEKYHYCKNKPECDALLETEAGIPSEICLRCALDWLQQPADKL